MKLLKTQSDRNSVNNSQISTGEKHLFTSRPKWSNIFILISPILFLYFITSCTPESCFEETNAFVKASFYVNDTGKRVAPDSLTVFGLGIDTVMLYNKGTNIQPALLPLDASSGKSTFIIRINGITDTMSLTYNSFPHLISKECGYSFYHTIDTTSFTKNIIDTIRILNKNITTLNEENLRIYY